MKRKSETSSPEAKVHLNDFPPEIGYPASEHWSQRLPILRMQMHRLIVQIISTWTPLDENAENAEYGWPVQVLA